MKLNELYEAKKHDYGTRFYYTRLRLDQLKELYEKLTKESQRPFGNIEQKQWIELAMIRVYNQITNLTKSLKELGELWSATLSNVGEND